jgi:hypothetical protein
MEKLRIKRAIATKEKNTVMTWLSVPWEGKSNVCERNRELGSMKLEPGKCFKLHIFVL